MNARAHSLAIVVLLATLAGCGGDHDFHYFDTKPYKTAACNARGDDRLAFRREINLFTNRNSDVPTRSTPGDASTTASRFPTSSPWTSGRAMPSCRT